jgi:hypothetical protein
MYFVYITLKIIIPCLHSTTENGESGGVGGAIKDAAKAAVDTAAKTALAAGRSHSCYMLDLI